MAKKTPARRYGGPRCPKHGTVLFPMGWGDTCLDCAREAREAAERRAAMEQKAQEAARERHARRRVTDGEREGTTT